jgi:hypothetical protein
LIAASKPKITDSDIINMGNIKEFDTKNRYDNFNREFKAIDNNFADASATTTVLIAYLDKQDKKTVRQMRMALSHIKEEAREANSTLFESLYERAKQKAPTGFERLAAAFKVFGNIFVSPKTTKQMTDEVEPEEKIQPAPKKYYQDLDHPLGEDPYGSYPDSEKGEVELTDAQEEAQEEAINRTLNEAVLNDVDDLLEELDKKESPKVKEQVRDEETEKLYKDLQDKYNQIDMPVKGKDIEQYSQQMISAYRELSNLYEEVKAVIKVTEDDHPNFKQLTNLAFNVKRMQGEISATLKKEQQKNSLSIESSEKDQLTLGHSREALSSLYHFEKPQTYVLGNDAKSLKAISNQNEIKDKSYIKEEKSSLDYIPANEEFDMSSQEQKIIKLMVEKAVRKFGCETDNDLIIECKDPKVIKFVKEYLPKAIENYTIESKEQAAKNDGQELKENPDMHLTLKHPGGE